MSGHDSASTPEPAERVLPPRGPQTLRLLKWLHCPHLPDRMEPVWGPIYAAAVQITAVLQDGPELTACLRKLVEAKDCAIRQHLEDEEREHLYLQFEANMKEHP